MTVRILIKSTVIAMKSLFKSEIFNWALKKTNQQIHINGELRTAISLNKLIGVTQTFFFNKIICKLLFTKYTTLTQTQYVNGYIRVFTEFWLNVC